MKKLSKISLILSIVLAVLTIALLSTTIVFSTKYTNTKDKLKKQRDAQTEVYDFYITLGTMPTLYATLNAYDNKNPNTYMWFYRGNTISYEHSADFIHYFPTQSTTNDKSTIDVKLIKQKVRDILDENPAAKFRLFCDDLRVRYILDIFVGNGIEFEDLSVTLLSDGTGTYSLYSGLTEDEYTKMDETWATYVQDYLDNSSDINYTKFAADYNGQAMEMQKFAFYISTFSNVSYWIQNPEFLKNDNSQSVNNLRYNMNIIKKDPRAIYQSLSEETRADYQNVVLANALVGSDTLHTLQDAVNYFDAKLGNQAKDVVLILGTSYEGLEHNQKFIDKTINYYTPTLESATSVKFKNKNYTITEGSTSFIADDSKEYVIGECSVKLFFKGHPAHPANTELMNYFNENHIEVLPHRTPVETLFWMYDVKVGGYQSTSFLSCYDGQTEFFYGEPTDGALVQMKEAGFFNNAVVFTED